MSDAELNQFLFESKCLTKLNLNAFAEWAVMQDQALPFVLSKLSVSCTAIQNTNIIFHYVISILPPVVVADFFFSIHIKVFSLFPTKTPYKNK